MSEEQRGVVLYGYGVDAVAEALRELDPRYVLVDRVAPESGQVPVPRCPHGAEADAAREAAPGVAWLVVELYRPEVDIERARDPLLLMNTSKVDPGMAARAIDQPDLEIWYEVINPIRATTVDGGPASDDYSNVAIIVPGGHRMVAHAVRAGGAVPECLPGGAEQVLPSHDLWALAPLGKNDVCRACTARHG
ncbi:hypothetical protein AB0L86_26455 [Micromonospora musae]|uniref:hypothetical protein n=1 Tax=Micromonospora musae TaxID=1894970 RepID=UPI003417E851